MLEETSKQGVLGVQDNSLLASESIEPNAESRDSGNVLNSLSPCLPVSNLFKIKPEERVQAAVALTVIVLLNALFIFRLHELFLQPGFGPYWKVFERELHLSGYDPLTYLTVTDWDVVYETHRHPLLAFLVWPLWLLNQGLTWLFGVNCVQYVVALPVITCSLYSYIFLYRIHREVDRKSVV